MASSDRDLPWSWIFCSMSRSSFWRFCRSSCLACWTFWTRARLSLPMADSWTIFWTSITPIFPAGAVADGVWAEAPPARTPKARAPAARVTMRFMNGTPSLILARAGTPSPRRRASYWISLERRPDRELEIRPGLALDHGARLVRDVLRLEIDAVDEPQGGLEDRQENPHLEPGRPAHRIQLRGLALEPRVSRVEKEHELEGAGHGIDVLGVEDEESVAPEESPGAREERPVLAVDRVDRAEFEAAHRPVPADPVALEKGKTAVVARLAGDLLAGIGPKQAHVEVEGEVRVFPRGDVLRGVRTQLDVREVPAERASRDRNGGRELRAGRRVEGVVAAVVSIPGGDRRGRARVRRIGDGEISPAGWRGRRIDLIGALRVGVPVEERHDVEEA